ncbi:hypothetical protein [Heyndrickxia acidicola]|uniref:Lipoprotein n=1 Tax=Heyndrickxia acidicola TaxID=209389 RepID=A0ABU6MDU7_9BACI|nr:hypothetical protein [Heyndrickxia acidicola]MED1202582.1 hypothetical protein [Heyndrickxia acidicola]
MKKTLGLLLPALLIFAGCSHSTSSSGPAPTSSQRKGENSNQGQNNKSNSSSTNDGNSSNQNPSIIGSNSNSKQSNSSTNTSPATQNSSNNSTSQQSRTNNKIQLKKKSVKITSGVAAAKYLRQKLNKENDTDTLFDDLGGAVDKDNKGTYYTIKLVSKSMLKNGGSGTLDIYKVYEDGTYQARY